MSDNMYQSLWTTLIEASKVSWKLVSSKCQKGCIKKCKCKKVGLESTPLCACDGECSQNRTSKLNIKNLNCSRQYTGIVKQRTYLHIAFIRLYVN